ncbi:MAG: bifunctional 2-polyprenyl-6-hydroxyphenol methylase/3-demethylubiquinol 3-O-methyltransferase UbiG [Deltaproteobacteria bacterium]|nr:bifunctional 2-polyprenyl-6-hydroxyphenol methylase/3-demethylubiquinol 3-O-methyltransferase UbiG [Deltaproteobacteria bacterium]MBW1993485.1 bifunctional 2-polyprenyl-6-hydroxyphenol methylase/3-demethylubiquinol 3-O-methyltransferase UbiG [Deltaproteobacteria bacterium]MBW2151328.1 bifunctional 2-polyprenyl-6-hydroxyphenol methylase/3-demethylubiquinol 3-O-methyltransferase UbiG [Deltaproteobacteria bacterium]
MSTRKENVDPAEIAKFESMASRWWNRQGEFKALHDINPLRLDYIRSRSVLLISHVLDVGCGGGILSEALASLGAKVTGIDMAETALSAARYHMRRAGFHICYRKISVESLSETEPCRFDVICCLELLEHVPNPSSVVTACSKLAKPGGNLFFATINRNIKSYIFAIIGAEYVLRLVPRGTHSFKKFIKPSDMQRWAQQAGLSFRDATGLNYNPFTKQYKLGGNVHVNYIMHFSKSE